MPKQGDLIVSADQEDFDTTAPVENIKAFLAFFRDVIARYEGNEKYLVMLNNATQDILHTIELSPNMNAHDGYLYYKTLRDIRRERRLLKSENELLEVLLPFYSENKSFFDTLSRLQGVCRTTKEHIAQRSYRVKTSELEMMG